LNKKIDNKKNTREKKKKSLFREYLEAAIIALILALFIRAFVIQAFKIPSGSMKPTLLIGDHILVNKFIYGIKVPFVDRYIIPIKKPKRGDVVVFKWPRDERKDFIKRVVGIEGDTIEIKNDVLYVNGKKIMKTYVGKYRDDNIAVADKYLELFDKSQHYILDEYIKHENYGPVIVPKNSIFVMGDNRDNSHDSRYWRFVSLNKLKGKAIIIYWSWPHLRRFGHLIK
jgi:signal peptidase I